VVGSLKHSPEEWNVFTIKLNAVNCTTMKEKVGVGYEYVIILEYIH